ncbi:MAG TPA: hypothetical protein DD733_03560 [Clostridiales bacterium]|nr:hypothetical protein [Eubacteriales bacterium]HBR31143.1 hypothetical protein [Clostridiales bacterium]
MKKLLPALALLLVSAVLLSTASYAWFSMNTQVTATGMDITAKSDSVFLLIGQDPSATVIQTAGTITTDLSASGNVLPSAHDAIANGAAAETYANWYTAKADTPTAGTLKEGTKTALTVDNFSQYVIKKTIYVTLATGSNDATDLVISDAEFTAVDGTGDTTITPVKVVVASSTAVVEVDSTTVFPSTDVLAATVTDAATVKLDIYVYYDGNDAAVYTNNVANLDGAGIVLTFSITA